LETIFAAIASRRGGLAFPALAQITPRSFALAVGGDGGGRIPAPDIPPLGNVGAGSGSSSTNSIFIGGFVALLLLLLSAMPNLYRRIELTAGAMRATPFLSLAERPG
jgi:hypothetical protein